MAFPTGWTKRCPLTLPTSWANGAASPGDVPVPITEALTDWPAGIFTDARSDGGDIRFSSDEAGTTELATEVALWDTTNSKCVFWVHVPDYSYTAATVIYVWYGAASETMPAADSTYGREAVWACGDADDFSAALHLYEAANTGAGGYLDSSTNDNDATGSSMSNTYVDGQIGKAQDLDGTDDYIYCADSATLSPGASLTASCWFKRDGTANAERLIQKESSSGNHFVWGLQVLADDKAYCSLATNLTDLSTNNYYGASSATMNDTDWHHVAFTFTSTGPVAKLYVDGAESGSGVPGTTGFGSGTQWTGGLYDSTGPLTIGKLRFASASYFQNGKIHDVRVSSAVRSAAYIYFEHQSAATQSAASAGSVTTIGGTTKPWYYYAQM